MYKKDLIWIIIIVLCLFISFYLLISILQINKKLHFIETKYQVYQELISKTVDKLQTEDPAIGGFVKDVDKILNNIETIQELTKLVQQDDEELIDDIKYTNLIKNHSIINYNNKYKFFMCPIRNINDPALIDKKTIIRSEYGPRWIKLNINETLRNYLNKHNIKSNYKGILYLPKWGYSKVKVYNDYLYFQQYHSGVDLVSKYNYSIYASYKGYISYIGKSEVWGKYIIINHYINGEYFKTCYAHLSLIYVKNKQKVDINTKIGILGNTGLSLGDHLHFSIKKYNKIKRKYYTINPFTNSTYNKKVCNDKYNRFM